MKKYIPILFLLFTVMVSQGKAGTLSVPSPYVLQRPLNPALITEIQSQGVAVSTIIDSFNSLAENNSCEAEILKHCRESGLGLLGYANRDGYYFQLEALGQISSEEGGAKSTRIRNRRDQQHYLGMVATTWKNFSVGILLQNNQFEFRKRQSFSTGSIENGGDEIEWFLNFGGTVNFWNQYYFSFYREEVLNRLIKDVHGRRTKDRIALGLYGLGVGGKFSPFENWKLSGELFQLVQNRTFEKSELLGGQLDIAWKSFMAYSTFIFDIHDNYFDRSGEGTETTKFSAGIAWYGEHYQVQLGRDPRFFDGLDGGIKLTVGYQF